MWEKRFGAQQEATGQARELARVHEKEMAGWESKEVTTPSGGLMAPGVRTLQPPEPKLISIGQEKFLKLGSKYTYIPKDKATDFMKRYGMYKAGEITKEEFLGIKPVAPSASIKNYEFYAAQERKAGRKPMAFSPWLKSVKKAGAPTMTQIVAGEKHELKKRISASELRPILLEDANKKKVFDTNADDFNVMSTSEVAYWDPSPRKWARDGITKFAKLTSKNLADGWTPKTVQEFAEHNNMTVYEVLKKIGTIR